MLAIRCKVGFAIAPGNKAEPKRLSVAGRQTTGWKHTDKQAKIAGSELRGRWWLRACWTAGVRVWAYRRSYQRSPDAASCVKVTKSPRQGGKENVCQAATNSTRQHHPWVCIRSQEAPSYKFASPASLLCPVAAGAMTSAVTRDVSRQGRAACQRCSASPLLHHQRTGGNRSEQKPAADARRLQPGACSPAQAGHGAREPRDRWQLRAAAADGGGHTGGGGSRPQPLQPPRPGGGGGRAQPRHHGTSISWCLTCASGLEAVHRVHLPTGAPHARRPHSAVAHEALAMVLH